MRQQTKIINQQLPTSYNNQLETIHQSRQLVSINHQLNSYIKPKNHKLQKDVKNLKASLEKVSVSN